MKTIKNKNEDMSRRDFLRKSAFGALSFVAVSVMGGTLFSSCSKDDDENDLAEQEDDIDEEEKKKNDKA